MDARDGAPVWEFPEPNAERPDAQPATAPEFSEPPPIDDVTFDVESGGTFWDRVLACLRRERRR
ncbi:MAG: hypothetical protein QNJ12_09605 [Ilumatobacter sp.]|uniref:hypothetical protein n=1 Tax=Ilumatobacter sp. TaxID=1967498 RepID=UPI002606F53B|nr:hypothetical protein [Ilumatobacter sp.]MDJ0769039.1 hypothetical protein [Ilumatobacter sp.]